MNRLPAILLLLSAVPAFADEELDRLAGTWDISSMLADGKEMPAGKGVPDQFVIKGGKFTLLSGGKPLGTFTDNKMVVDPKKTPKTLDLIREAKGDELPAIYELKEDELRIAMPLVPTVRKKGELLPRPDSFETKGKPYLVVTAKRKK